MLFSFNNFLRNRYRVIMILPVVLRINSNTKIYNEDYKPDNYVCAQT